MTRLREPTMRRPYRLWIDPAWFVDHGWKWAAAALFAACVVRGVMG